MDQDSTLTGSIPVQEKQERDLRGIKLRLAYLTGKDKGKHFDLPLGVTIVGRAEGDLVIDDPKISRKHALFEILGPDVYYLKDLASTNGSYVNDSEITLTKLDPGDMIRFGDTMLKLYVLKD